MLILTRRVGEALIVGDDVTIAVLGVKGNQVRMGIKAPRDIAVHRQEVHARIRQEQEIARAAEDKSAQNDPDDRADIDSK